MASEVGICNSALTKIGAGRIVALDDGSKNANACAELYPKLRDDLLRRHAWNFACVRLKLARLAAAPAFGYAYAYQLPSDWLRTVAVYEDDAGQALAEYRVEGRTILSSAEALYIVYVRAVGDPNDMPSDFREALASMLACDLAVPIAQSSSLRQEMDQAFRDALARAKSVDAVEDCPERLPDGAWVTVRR